MNLDNEGGQPAALIPPADRLISVDELVRLTGIPKRSLWRVIGRLGVSTWHVPGDRRTMLDSQEIAVALLRLQRPKTKRSANTNR